MIKSVPEDLKKLDERIKNLQKKEANFRAGKKEESSFERFAKIGFRVGTELFAGVLAGGAIGYFLDVWFASKPWLLIVFLFLGGAAGVLNVYKFAKSEEIRKE